MAIMRRPTVEQMRRCIQGAMGCLDPLSTNNDERLAWFRLQDALEGREPRSVFDYPRYVAVLQRLG